MWRLITERNRRDVKEKIRPIPSEWQRIISMKFFWVYPLAEDALRSSPLPISCNLGTGFRLKKCRYLSHIQFLDALLLDASVASWSYDQLITKALVSFYWSFDILIVIDWPYSVIKNVNSSIFSFYESHIQIYKHDQLLVFNKLSMLNYRSFFTYIIFYMWGSHTQTKCNKLWLKNGWNTERIYR